MRSKPFPASPPPDRLTPRSAAYRRSAAGLLACTLALCAPSLFAKPTHLASHDSTRRLILAPPPPHARAHEPAGRKPRAERRPAAHPAKSTHTAGPHTPASSARPAISGGRSLSSDRLGPPLRVAGRTSEPNPIDAATLRSVHAWEQAQHAATPSAATPQAAAASPAGTESLLGSPSGTPAPSLLADPANTANLLRTSPELPRLKSIEEEALSPILLPSLYDGRGRLVVPAPLFGSRDILLHQNRMADHDGLNRVRDDAELLNLRRDKQLVPLPSNQALAVDQRLPLNRRFSRPWTAQFLAALAQDHFASFHLPLQVNSAVRTVQFQRRLLRTNGNAAPADGDTASPHLTGQAVDIGKRGLSLPEIAWMRAYLQPLIDQGKIDVEEEFQQSCFHISVYKTYTAKPQTTLASTRRLPPEPAF